MTDDWAGMGMDSFVLVVLVSKNTTTHNTSRGKL